MGAPASGARRARAPAAACSGWPPARVAGWLPAVAPPPRVTHNVQLASRFRHVRLLFKGWDRLRAHNVQLASRSRQVQNRPSRQSAISSTGKSAGAVESGRGPMPTVTWGS